MLKTHAQKKFNFQHYYETKTSQIIVFWSDREIVISQNAVLSLNCEIKIGMKFKDCWKIRENLLP